MSVVEPERGMVEYLLGKLAEEGRQEVESRLFTDDRLEEDLLSTADELIEAYLDGRLSPDDRRRFETHFLAVPRHRQRLALIEDLRTAVEQETAETGPAARPRTVARLPWAMAAVAMLAVAALVPVLLRAPEPTSPPTRRPAAELPSPRADTTPAAGPEVEVLHLPALPGTAVGVRLTSTTRSVRVEVKVDEESPTFDAVVLTPEGREVWRAEDLAPAAAGEPLVFSVPAQVLSSNRYALRIEGERMRERLVEGPLVLEYPLSVLREH